MDKAEVVDTYNGIFSSVPLLSCVQLFVTMEYYSVIKKDETMLFAATGMPPEIIIPIEVNQRKTNIM